MGRSDIVRLLLEAGADPSLRDNLGLTAIDWAQRKGFIDVTQLLKSPQPTARRPSSSATVAPNELDSKREVRDKQSPPETQTRAASQEQQSRFGPAATAFLKSQARPSNPEPTLVQPRLQTEQSIPKESKSDFSQDPSAWWVGNTDARTADDALPTEPDTLRTRLETEKIFEQARERVDEEVRRKTQEQARRATPDESRTRQAARETTSLKRCPKCNTIYEDDGRTYCAYDAGRLVNLQEAFDGSATSSFGRPTLWALVALTLIGSVAVTYLATTYFNKTEVSSPAATVAAEKVPTAEDNSPVVGGALAGKQENVPRAEYPANFKTEGPLEPVTVVVRVNRNGRVISAQALNGPRPLRGAAEKAARAATFLAEKLNDEEPVAAGTITYTFKP